jgi:hypothetical protein
MSRIPRSGFHANVGSDKGADIPPGIRGRGRRVKLRSHRSAPAERLANTTCTSGTTDATISPTPYFGSSTRQSTSSDSLQSHSGAAFGSGWAYEGDVRVRWRRRNADGADPPRALPQRRARAARGRSVSSADQGVFVDEDAPLRELGWHAVGGGRQGVRAFTERPRASEGALRRGGPVGNRELLGEEMVGDEGGERGIPLATAGLLRWRDRERRMLRLAT